MKVEDETAPNAEPMTENRSLFAVRGTFNLRLLVLSYFLLWRIPSCIVFYNRSLCTPSPHAREFLSLLTLITLVSSPHIPFHFVYRPPPCFSQNLFSCAYLIIIRPLCSCRLT